MGLIDEAVDAFENEVNNLKLNIKDTVQAMDYEYTGSLYDTVLTTKLVQKFFVLPHVRLI